MLRIQFAFMNNKPDFQEPSLCSFEHELRTALSRPYKALPDPRASTP